MTLSTMPNRDKPFPIRLDGPMGEISEQIFVTWATKQGWIVERNGADKSQLDHRQMDFYLRNQPDYLTQTPNGIFYVEVKGGNSGTVKVKQDSLEAARYYNMYQPFRFFFTNTSTMEFAAITFEGMKQIIRDNRVNLDYFKDGNAFYLIKREWLKWYSIDATRLTPQTLQLTQQAGQAAKGDNQL